MQFDKKIIPLVIYVIALTFEAVIPYQEIMLHKAGLLLITLIMYCLSLFRYQT